MSLTIRLRFPAASIESVLVASIVMKSTLDDLDTVLIARGIERPNVQILCPACMMLGCHQIERASFAAIHNALEHNDQTFVFGEHTYVLAVCAPDLTFTTLAPHEMLSFDDELMPLLHNATPIGVGATAKVFTACVEHTTVAIKVFTIAASQFAGEKGKGGAAHPLSICLTELKRELAVSTALADHPNILHMVGFSAEPLCLIVEFCAGGDLFHFLHSPDAAVSWARVLRFATEICRAMVALHQLRVIHRDLKSPNILLKPAADGQLTCVVSDFGLSGRFSNEPVDVDNPRWTAPEALEKKVFYFESDVYSFGIILWELATRREPFGDEKFASVLREKIIKGARPEIPAGFPQHRYRDIILRCWDANTLTRPKFTALFEELEDFCLSTDFERASDQTIPLEAT